MGTEDGWSWSQEGGVKIKGGRDLGSLEERRPNRRGLGPMGGGKSIRHLSVALRAPGMDGS